MLTTMAVLCMQTIKWHRILITISIFCGVHCLCLRPTLSRIVTTVCSVVSYIHINIIYLAQGLDSRGAGSFYVSLLLCEVHVYSLNGQNRLPHSTSHCALLSHDPVSFSQTVVKHKHFPCKPARNPLQLIHVHVECFCDWVALAIDVHTIAV